MHDWYASKLRKGFKTSLFVRCTLNNLLKVDDKSLKLFIEGNKDSWKWVQGNRKWRFIRDWKIAYSIWRMC